MSRVRPEYVMSFGGGLNTADDDLDLDEGQVPDCNNVTFDRSGGFRRRPTWQVRTGAVVPADILSSGIVHLRTSDLANGLTATVALRDNSTRDLYFSADCGVSWVRPEWAGFKLTNVEDVVWWGDAAYTCSPTPSSQTNVIDASGTVTARHVATTFSTYTAPVNRAIPGVVAATHLSYVFAAEGTTLRWSHPNNPLAYHADDFITINNGGGTIRAIVSNGDHLLVFQESGIAALFGYDSDSWHLVEVSSTLGVRRSTHVVKSDVGVFFLSYGQGIFRIAGSTSPEPVSSAIKSVFTTGLGPQHFTVGWADRKVWVVVSSNTYVLDVDTNAWTRFSFSASSSTHRFGFVFEMKSDVHGGDAKPTVPRMITLKGLPMNYRDGMGFLTDTFLEGGSLVTYPINAHVRTRWVHGGAPTLKKQFRRPDLIVKYSTVPNTLTLDSYRDYDTLAVSRTKTVTVGAVGGADGASSEIVRGGSLGPARAVSLKVSSSVSRPWGVDAIVFKFVPRRMR